MKRKRIQLDEPVADNEEFKPQMLITLDNQYPTHKILHSESKGIIDTFEHSPFEKIAEAFQRPRKELLASRSNLDSLMSNRSFTQQLPTLKFYETEVNFAQKDNRFNSSGNLPPKEADSFTLRRRQSKLMKKVNEIKQVRTIEHSQPGLIANTSYLNGVLKQERTKNIARNFIKKIKKKKVDDRYILELNQQEPAQSIFSIKGLEMHENVGYTLKVLQILFTCILLFVNSIQLVFDGVLSQEIAMIKIASIIFYAIEFLTSLLTVKKVSGRRFQNLNEIWQHLGIEKISLDLINIFIIIADLAFEGRIIILLRMFVIVKVPQLWKNMEQVQIKLITSNENEKYWSLVKVMLFNFCFAHILAITLTAMVAISPHQNWMTVKDIANAEWFEKYIWSYYWGTNIMLTVGFGDIAASNYKEAICLIFIETVSCIVLAYNVNCVGELIMNIRSKDDEKKKQIKLFKKITESSEISNELNWKITNYIEESINLKKNFNFDEEYKFIGNLPKYLKYDFLKQTHKTVFNNLPFFRFMMEKTIYSIAQKIEMLMSHPEQIIRNKTEDFNLWIMRSGEVGLVCSRGGSDLNNQIVDKIVLENNAQPFVLSLNFITKQQLAYEFKSLEYSSFYFMQFGKLIQCLRENDSDFQYYAFMRDKINNIPDQFQVKRCSICQDRFHYKFNCPAIHYLPNKDKIVVSHLRELKFSKNTQRVRQFRGKESVRALEVYHYYKLNKIDNEISQHSNYSSNLLGEESFNVKGYKGETMFLQDDGSSEIQMAILQAYQISDGFKQLKEFISGEMQKTRFADVQSDPIWLIKSDVMMDYSKYFNSDNPSLLATKIEGIKTRRKVRSK